ncbi:unnamed protein product [Orchesella dallaii]|uniref:EGF-like domain-containing protein n=1 Tax=Orchesella dallaii TaxID=48710 RepID=A0ABP1S495_9HEXA
MCNCNVTNAIFDRFLKTCAIKFGNHCHNSVSCVRNSYCRDKFCSCDSGYFGNYDGECERLRFFNEPCGNNYECGPDSGGYTLICNSVGRCDCQGSRPHFNREYGCCVLAAGDQCSLSYGGFSDCVANSVCVSYPIGANILCTCNDGFIQTDIGTCEPDNNGESCTLKENCNIYSICESHGFCDCEKPGFEYDALRQKCLDKSSDATETNGTRPYKRGIKSACNSDAECDKEAFLTCSREKVCDCNIRNSRYDQFLKKCAIKIGNRCHNSVSCVRNAYCRDKFCSCDSGYFGNYDGECERLRFFNEPCGNNYECGSDSGGYTLICNSVGRCDCQGSRPHFNREIGCCVLAAGDKCSLSYHGFSACVAKSTCIQYPSSGEAVCTCNDGYFQTKSGTCLPKQNYGDKCNANKPCNKNMVCGPTGICECEKPRFVYDPLKEMCLLSLNLRCSNNEECTTNAHCVSDPDLDSAQKICKCQNESSPNQEGGCQISFGGQCTEEAILECNKEQGTICKEGFCACKSGIFNLEVNKCVNMSLVLGPCDNSTICVKNSHCSQPENENDDDYVRKCVCDEGFVPVDYECKLTIGQPCKYASYKAKKEVDMKENQVTKQTRSDSECDPIAALRCINGTCQCENLEDEYDTELRKCRGLVGSLCDLKDDKYCPPNSNCIPQWTYLSGKGRCACNKGYKSTKTRVCVEDTEEAAGTLGEDSG